MKDLERVLAGLRDVEAPAGLEARVLRRMEERGGRRSWGWAAGGVVLAAAVLGVGLEVGRGRHTPGAKAPVVAGVHERPKAKALGYLQARAGRDLQARAGRDLQARAGRDLQARAGRDEGVWRGGHTPGAKAPVLAGVHERPKAEALGYLQARAGTGRGEEVSFPAPEAPLTEEERLLVRIAVTGNEPAFEILNEETREASAATSEAEFEEFVRSAASSRPQAGSLDLPR